VTRTNGSYWGQKVWTSGGIISGRTPPLVGPGLQLGRRKDGHAQQAIAQRVWPHRKRQGV